MIEGIYTETLAQFLERNENSSPWQDIKSRFGLMPVFNVGGLFDRNFYELFIEKYDIREIGSETEELFLHFWKEKTNELILKYKPKMDMWLEHFNELFKFTVQLVATENMSNNNQNTYYLNPVSKTTENLKVSDVDKTEYNRERTITRDVLQTVWGKTRADILNKILEVKDVFNDCLAEFEVIFMGVM